MFLVRGALNNSYAVLALVLGLCLLGAAVIPQMPVDILPDFQKPVVVSYFSYPGLPTGEMEKSVTSRVERALTLAGRIEHQESRTLPGASMLKIAFQPGTNPSSAMNDIVNLEASDMFHLPPGIEHPFTLRSEPANMPVALAAISGKGLSETELYKIGYYAVRNKMGGLKGVQIPHPFGGKFRQMMVYVNPAKLSSFGLSTKDVVDALKKANLVLAGGTVKLGTIEYQLHPQNTLPTTSDIEAVPIAVRGNTPIYIRDVGYAADDAAIQYNIVRVNGSRSVYCPLLREPGENTIAVVDRISEAVETEVPRMRERKDIPEQAKVTLVSDQSIYIRNALRSLAYVLGLGAILVAVVVFGFLRRLLPSLIIVLVMVLSVLIGGLGFWMAGYTINLMTLGGLSLAIGTVVDAGIVVVENILRHQRMGKEKRQAAEVGASEVAGPVFAGTLTTLIVFTPVIFLSGMVKYLFEPLSVAAIMTVGASLFLALTLVPVFCARFLANTGSPDSDSQNDDISEEPKGWYAKVLDRAFTLRWPVVIGMVVLVGVSFCLLPFIGTELFPTVDAGTFEIRMRTAPGTKLDNTETLVAKIEDAVKDEIPEDEIQTIISNIGLPVGKGAGFSTILSPNSGPDSAFIVVNLKNENRSTSTTTYLERLRVRLQRDFPQEQFLFTTGDIVNAALNEGIPVPISIQVSAGSLEQCAETAGDIVERIEKIPGTADVQIAQALDYPQLDIQIDRTQAARMGLTQDEIAKTILTAYGSSIGYDSTIWVDPKSGIDFFMGVQYQTNEASSLSAIRNLPLSVKTKDGRKTVPLSNIATVRRVTIPGEISHYNISRVNDVYVNVSGRDVGSVATDVERALRDVELKPGVGVVLRGPVKTMRESTQALVLGLIIAGVLIYLVMMAQFRSFVDPVLIVLAIPLGLGGVLATLWLTGTAINIQSLLGTLMMLGVVVNNSILLVEFANVLRRRGVDTRRAILKASQTRLRPILMTSLTLIASMLPLSFAFAPGSEAIMPLARALIGGMVVSTFLTLFLVPCAYLLVKGSLR
ncbi:MAG: efflux RND transporter permease subunit [Gemmataceae bacterium]